MQVNQFIQADDPERVKILRSIDFDTDQPLLMAVEAMVDQARQERPTHPAWHPLSARNAEGIARLRETLEASGGWSRDKTSNHLEGVCHLESGRFIAVHNTCERTGLDIGLPRFASARSRSATKSLRDDLQGNFGDLIEGFEPLAKDAASGDDMTLHLCVFIQRETSVTGELEILVRAELVVGAVFSDLGVTAYKYRLPLDVSRLTGTVAGADSSAPEDQGPVEADIHIRKRQ